MSNSTAEQFSGILRQLSALKEIRAIGKTGGSALPADGSDIDVFIFCDVIPTPEARIKALSPHKILSQGELEGPFWGLTDYLDVGGLDICLMFFTAAAFTNSVESILRGERLEREGNCFYPVGRCASVLDMHVYFERDGYLSDLQNRLRDYPELLARKMIARHIGSICDEEDFGRAVARGDVLFYHATLDLALDSFLQMLFAVNRRFFPSRKRSAALVADFALQPADCAARMQRTVELGAHSETLAESFRLWSELCNDLCALADISP